MGQLKLVVLELVTDTIVANVALASGRYDGRFEW